MAEHTGSEKTGLHIVVQGTNPVADIIAVHGLGAHPYYTWVKKIRRGDKAAKKRNLLQVEDKDIEVMWLKDLLPQVIPDARILKYNYDSNYLINSPKDSLRSIADRLVNSIHEQRAREEGTVKRPIVFVGHSFGGVVIQEALLLAHREITKKLEYISESTCGIIFLGTPHRGSGAASWGKIIANCASVLDLRPDTQLLHTLEVGSERLDLLLNDFTVVARSVGIELVCFYESRETEVLRRYGPVGKLVKFMVVDKSSATIDGYEHIALPLDHSGLNKFASTDDEAFRLVSLKLKELVKGAQDLINKRALCRSKKKYFLVPYPENKTFTPRDEPYGQLCQLIPINKSLEDQTRIGVIGLGGVGKTQIALQLAYQHKSTSNVFWIHGNTRGNFMQCYLEMARTVGLLENRGAGRMKEDFIGRVKEWLDSDLSGQWLMIIDNADDLSANMLNMFRSALPVSRGTLLFTTRDSNIAGAGGLIPEGFQVELGVMSDSESKTTFLKLSGKLGSSTNGDPDVNGNQQIQTLMELLGNLPLAISQAATYIKKRRIPVTRYISIFQASEEKRAKLLSDPIMLQERYESVPKSIMCTWEITFSQLARENKVVSCELLQIMSLLDTQYIPRSLLDSDKVRLALKCEDEIDFDNAMEPLLSFSLANACEDRYSYNVHCLVGLWTRKRMEEVRFIRLALDLVLTVFPPEPLRNTQECLKLLPHALSILTHSEPHKHMYSDIAYDRAALELKVAVHYICAGAFVQAEILLNDCLKLYRSGDNRPEQVSRCMHYLGLVSYKKSSYDEAMQWYQQALLWKKQALGADHPSTLNTINDMANVFREQGKIREALELYEQALESKRNTLGESHRSTLCTANNLATLFRKQGQLDRALELHEQVLEGYEMDREENRQSIADTVYYIALTLDELERHSEALESYGRALTRQEKLLGTNHPSTLLSLYHLIDLQLRVGGTDPIQGLISRLCLANNVYCKYCSQFISGAFYKCRSCKEKDFCEECVKAPEIVTGHSGHGLVRLTENGEVIPLADVVSG